jgi:cytochrome c-type biogenesis protein CcmH/NrfG
LSAMTNNRWAGSAERWSQAEGAREGSLPQLGDLETRGGDLDDELFDEGRVALERRRALMSPEARSRRARFARYVIGTVAAATVLCAAAFVKTAFEQGWGVPSQHASAAPSAAAAPEVAAVEPPAPALAPAPAPEPARAPAPEPAVAAAPAPAVAMATEPVTAQPGAAQAPGPEVAPVEAVQTTQAAAANPAPAGNAKKDRESARFALERGDLGGAITSGERSVGLDPTDGEAWLILGAAYQSRGELTEAKRCYRACVDQATRGPKGECRAMAQGR